MDAQDYRSLTCDGSLCVKITRSWVPRVNIISVDVCDGDDKEMGICTHDLCVCGHHPIH